MVVEKGECGDFDEGAVRGVLVVGLLVFSCWSLVIGERGGSLELLTSTPLSERGLFHPAFTSFNLFTLLVARGWWLIARSWWLVAKTSLTHTSTFYILRFSIHCAAPFDSAQ